MNSKDNSESEKLLPTGARSKRRRAEVEIKNYHANEAHGDNPLAHVARGVTGTTVLHHQGAGAMSL